MLNCFIDNLNNGYFQSKKIKDFNSERIKGFKRLRIKHVTDIYFLQLITQATKFLA